MNFFMSPTFAEDLIAGFLIALVSALTFHALSAVVRDWKLDHSRPRRPPVPTNRNPVEKHGRPIRGYDLENWNAPGAVIHTATATTVANMYPFGKVYRRDDGKD